MGIRESDDSQGPSVSPKSSISHEEWINGEEQDGDIERDKSQEEGGGGRARGSNETGEEEEHERRVVKGIPMPELPSEREVTEHNDSGHVPFRSWCMHCVKGRATNRQHMHQETEEDTKTAVMIDYMYMEPRSVGREGEEEDDEEQEKERQERDAHIGDDREKD